ncbi:MAG: 1-acyl-sn-glycerol-3-phosphate acyltransferase [Ardenticatenaceae bacterium]|nr:1-acyl-sn-glycerol-3-phosphate acyltransferase [Ardenticatenaceae bacterium]
MRKTILYPILRNLVRFLLWLFIDLEITGEENLTEERPLIIIGNHFSLFEAPLIELHLPFKFTFFAAVELEQNAAVRLLLSVIDAIMVHRSRADREALRQATAVLQAGGRLLIMPEGGIDPELRDTLARGEERPFTEGMNSRISGQLIAARPGTAYLATRSQARILPIAFLGTEHILDNIRRLKRTKVTMHIGPVFGPLILDPVLRGPARRHQLDAYGDEMMHHIAALMPPENRGPYNDYS